MLAQDILLSQPPQMTQDLLLLLVRSPRRGLGAANGVWGLSTVSYCQSCMGVTHPPPAATHQV